MTIAAKICGISTPEALDVAVACGAAYVGFVHFPASPRHVNFQQMAALSASLPASVKSVAVVVDPSDELLAELIATAKPAYVQLHGTEAPLRLKAIKAAFPGLGVIKALSVSTFADTQRAGAFSGVADMLLFDAKPPKDGKLPGGNGISFDWSILAGRSFALPWFLSGGLDTDNVAAALAQSGAQMVDVSSGVEVAAGVKDPEKIKHFLSTVHSYDASKTYT